MTASPRANLGHVLASGLRVALMSMKTPETSVGLLARLKGVGDSEAWSRFDRLYGPHLIDWCRRNGLQEADARDVSQEVLITLARSIARFEYEPPRKFRGWLRVVVQSALADWARRRKPWNAASGDSEALRQLYELPDREDLVVRIESQYDHELLELAMARVRGRVEPGTWDAFRLLALEGLSGREAAERLGMKAGTVFAAKSKVQRLVKEAIESLDRYA